MATEKHGTETVRLNVGGTKYEVSRSLIEMYPDTMLARMISKTWHSDPEGEIFIDRDGLRFRYVLDYMRDKRAFPLTVSVASVVHELSYFGFEDVSEVAIDGSSARAQAAKTLSTCRKEHEEENQKLVEAIKNLKNHKAHADMAFSIFKYNCETGSLSYGSYQVKRGPFDLKVFQQELSKYGLRCVSYSQEQCRVELAYLETNE